MGVSLRRACTTLGGAVTIGVTLLVACGDAYEEEGAPKVETDALPSPTSDAAFEGGPAIDADAGCPPVYMPAEGTYLYRPYLGGDELTVNDAAVALEPFLNPFVVTVVHRPLACFDLTAFLSKGDRGEHQHTWRFCNGCAGGVATLDVENESDHFAAKAIGADQTTAYSCARPNPFMVADLAPDATIQQGACTGQGTGTRTYTMQASSVGYRFVGKEDVSYTDFDASRPTFVFERKSKVLVAGAGNAELDTSLYKFDIDSGLPMTFIVFNETKTKIGDLDVLYKLRLIMLRADPAVSPLP